MDTFIIFIFIFILAKEPEMCPTIAAAPSVQMLEEKFHEISFFSINESINLNIASPVVHLPMACRLINFLQFSFHEYTIQIQEKLLNQQCLLTHPFEARMLKSF